MLEEGVGAFPSDSLYVNDTRCAKIYETTSPPSQ